MSEKVADELVALWAKGETPDIVKFLDSKKSSERFDILAVLLVDQSFRWKNAQPYPVERYLELFPEWQASDDEKVELLIGEFRAQPNDRLEEKVESFASRFPELEETVRTRLTKLVDIEPQERTTDHNKDFSKSNDGNLTETGSLFHEDSDGIKYLGRYRLSRILGQGGFGRVYLGFDTELRRQVAIKVPREDRFQDANDADAYLEEARTVASLDHSNIVPVYDTGRLDDRTVYIVSKYIEGCTFKEYMHRENVEVKDKVEMLATVALALSYAHQQHLIHRDVKPGNILIEESSNSAYVADFGLAIYEGDFIVDGQVVGTPAYMSPEQIRGEGHRLDGRSDIFSLGVIFYEVLTGLKPFQGASKVELLQQSIYVDPKPPSEVNRNVPIELERICLKALEKRASDRYQSASDFADDLIHWVKGKEKKQKTNAVVTPQGLRSFGKSDSSFFLDLLPGPFDRDGVPESIQFWKSRIQLDDVDDPFSVGLIYGPSGSGKSSFIKAGLLACLDEAIDVVYVEATANDTESRILNRLRGVVRHNPDSAGTLTETLTDIRRNKTQKILIVVDQFEQWLHSNPLDDQSELVKAFRQCDGVSLQVILLVRDDFWLATSRFMRAVEVELVQGHNIALVDLFEKDHAKKVLTKFGQAFGKLPGRQEEFSEPQNRFVEQVIDRLATDDKIVSVRLALVSEMIKTKPWTVETLDAIGGIEGVGLTFLNETFVARTANPKHRLHQGEAARRILGSLLPDVGTDIKGHMRSREELRIASGYDGREQDLSEVLEVLDREVRLITPTEKEKNHGVLATNHDVELSQKSGSKKYYQLTHDYLVASIREWLTLAQRETRRGRHELKLAEYSSIWNSVPATRNLPSPVDWISINAFTQSGKWTPEQRSLMKTTNGYYGIRTAVLAMSVLLVVALSFFLRQNFADRQSNAEAHRIVQGLLHADTSQVGTIIDEQLAPFEKWSKDDLERAFLESPFDSNAKLHAALALLKNDESVVPFLQKRLLSVTASQFKSVWKLVENQKELIIEPFWENAFDKSLDSSSRFRAACFLAVADSEHANWLDPEFAQFVSTELVDVLPSQLPLWRDALRPVKQKLTPSMIKYFKSHSNGSRRLSATKTLLDYFSTNPKQLVLLLEDADETQLGQIIRVLEPQKEKAISDLSISLKKNLELVAKNNPPENRNRRISNLGVALMLFEEMESVFPLLAASEDPTVGNLILDRFWKNEGDSNQLMKSFVRQTDLPIKRSLLICLGNYSPKQIAPGKRKEFETLLWDHIKSTADPGLIGAAKFVVDKWGNSEEWKRVTTGLAMNDSEVLKRIENGKNWYVNSNNLAFAVVDGDTFKMGSPQDEKGRSPVESHHSRVLNRRFAVCLTEITKADWRAFSNDNNPRWLADQNQLKTHVPNDDCPMLGMEWYEAAKYCNWLSEKSGIPKAQWCYVPNSENKFAPGMKAKENSLELIGYRMLTEAEWEYTCRCGTTSPYSFGSDTSLIGDYAWYRENSARDGLDRHTFPVGILKPNRFGLFDMLGNAAEWCHDEFAIYELDPDDPMKPIVDQPVFSEVRDVNFHTLRGGSFLDSEEFVRSAARNRNSPKKRGLGNGLRVGRTLPKSKN